MGFASQLERAAQQDREHIAPMQEEGLLEAAAISVRGGLGKLSLKELSALYTSGLVVGMMKALPSDIKGGKHQAYAISGGAGAHGEGINRADMPVKWDISAVINNKPFMIVNLRAEFHVTGRAKESKDWTLKWDGDPKGIVRDFRAFLKGL